VVAPIPLVLWMPDVTSNRKYKMIKLTVTSAKYTLNLQKDGNGQSIEAVIDGRTEYVPLDPNNMEYAAILNWVAEGNTIEDAEIPTE
jgi:hypothetical protein